MTVKGLDVAAGVPMSAVVALLEVADHNGTMAAAAC